MVRTLKRMFMTCCSCVSQHLLGVTENTHENPQSGQSMTWSTFQLGITQIQVHQTTPT